ncbi:MAG: twin-arginine translocase subunit TatC [Verrucomicrobiota bacterium]
MGEDRDAQAPAVEQSGTKEHEEPLAEEEDGGGEVKSFLEHLEDLRWTLIKSLSALILAMIGCLVAGKWLAGVLTRPIEKSGVNIRLDYLDPAAPFMSAIHMAFFGGIIIAAPVIFYQLALFILPALKRKEKKYFFRACAIGSGLFLSGVTVCYFLIMPLALNAAVKYSHWLLNQPFDPKKEVLWRAEPYFSFTSKFMVGMGLGFELPVVLLTLVRLGVLDYQKLSALRRYMIVICLVLGAVLTTPEVVTQVAMAVPLYVLYEASVWIAWYWEKQDKKKLEAEAGLAANEPS